MLDYLAGLLIPFCVWSHSALFFSCCSPKYKGPNTMLIEAYCQKSSDWLLLFLSQYLEDIEKYGSIQETVSILVQACLGFFYIKRLIEFLEKLWGLTWKVTVSICLEGQLSLMQLLSSSLLLGSQESCFFSPQDATNSCCSDVES